MVYEGSFFPSKYYIYVIYLIKKNHILYIEIDYAKLKSNTTHKIQSFSHIKKMARFLLSMIFLKLILVAMFIVLFSSGMN